MSASPPVLRFTAGAWVVPGDRIGTIRQVKPGTGTYLHRGHVYASVVGPLQVLQEEAVLDETNPPAESSSAGETKLQAPSWRISVPATASSTQHVMLQEGHVVLGRVTRILPQQAIVSILALHDTSGSSGGTTFAPGQGPEGSIRKEDIRGPATSTTASTKTTDESAAAAWTHMEHAFRPGDLVLARVLSVGDTRRYVLGTAEPHLGVLYATCAASGHAMTALSWQEMQCPVTGSKEFRQVAKPNPHVLRKI